jgi:hypothetical protein
VVLALDFLLTALMFGVLAMVAKKSGTGGGVVRGAGTGRLSSAGDEGQRSIAESVTDKGYKVTARFENIGGLKVPRPSRLGGVRIGRVVNVGLDSQTYEAVVTMSIDPRYDRLPTDSSASILTSGLLGEQYVGLEPGGMDTYLKTAASEIDPIRVGAGKTDRPHVD